MAVARMLAVSLLLWATASTLATAQRTIDVEHSGTLPDIRVSKTNLASGASAELSFDLEYVVGVTALMGAPIINCGLRVRNLRGNVTVNLMNERRVIPITSENSEQVVILHLGFVLHSWGAGLLRGWTRGVTVNCQPGVIARDDTQPFNVPSNPGLDRFFCANAEMPVTRTLPDMLGPDWCSDLGGTYAPADVARELFREGVMDIFGDGWGSAFNPNVIALGIGVVELISAERTLMRELSREQDQADAEADTTTRPDPSTTISRLAAERARVAQDASANSEQGVAIEADRGDGNHELAAVRASADQVRAQALRECRANPPTPFLPVSESNVDVETARVLGECQGQAPRVLRTRNCAHRTNSGCSAGRCIILIPYCTPEDYTHNGNVESSQRAWDAWSRTNTCEADAASFRAEFIARSRSETQERNRQALIAWESAASDCEARAVSAHEQSIAEAEAAALRARSLRQLLAP